MSKLYRDYREKFCDTDTENVVDNFCVLDKIMPNMVDCTQTNCDVQDKCTSCPLHSECELEEEYRLLAKSIPKSDFINYLNQERGCCALSRHFELRPCGTRKVSDGVGDDFRVDVEYSHTKGRYLVSSVDYMEKWQPETPIFISAQTGGGKNHFIENNLLPYLRELNINKKCDMKVLIISNRIALRLQMENRIKHKGIDEEAVSQYRDFECADVIMYQGLLGFIDRLTEKQKSQYLFVVCDEAQFFTSDAMFNPDTEKILTRIAGDFQYAVRIYMSATPYECLEFIVNAERKCGLFYHFKRNYDYLDVKYYSHIDELKDIIQESVKHGEKWLIFIDNKDVGKKFQKILEGDKREADTKAAKAPDLEGKVFTMNSEDKFSDAHWHMVTEETFDANTKVLISTSVLDNGINLTGIHNIVVSDISKVKCLQMVGRARVKAGNRITLYIKRFNEKDIEKRISHLQAQQDAYHAFDLMIEQKGSYADQFYNNYFFGKPQDWENAKHWFRRLKQHKIATSIILPSQCELYPNEIARLLADKMIKRYRFILDEMRTTDAHQNASGQKYLEYQLSWFGKDYDIGNDITFVGKKDAENELVHFLERYAKTETQMFENEQKKFREDITKLHDLAFPRRDKNKGREYGIKIINAMLKEHSIGYVVESRTASNLGENKQYWIVVKINNMQVSE